MRVTTGEWWVFKGDELRSPQCPAEQTDEPQQNAKEEYHREGCPLIQFTFPFEMHFVSVRNRNDVFDDVVGEAVEEEVMQRDDYEGERDVDGSCRGARGVEAV